MFNLVTFMLPHRCKRYTGISRTAESLLGVIARTLMHTALLTCCIIQAYAQAANTEEDADDMYHKALEAIAKGDVDHAQSLLKQMLQAHPMHAGAWMDAALLHCQLGNQKVAMQLWREVEQRFEPSGGIAEFIALQRKQGCIPKPVPTHPLWQLQAGRGHTSNVNQGPRSMHISLPNLQGPIMVELLPSSMPHADAFTHLEASVNNVALPYGLSGSAQWQSRHYDTFRSQDLQSLATAVVQTWKSRNWQGVNQMSFALTTLDSQLYQRQLQAKSYITPPWQPTAPWRWHTSIAWANLGYPRLQNFNAQRAELGVHLEHASAQHWWLASFQSLHDHGSAGRPGGNRIGLGINLQINSFLGQLRAKPLILQSSIEWQKWNSKSFYIPGFIDAYRRQNSISTTAKLIWKQSENSQIFLEAKYIRNTENIQLFSYDLAQISAGWKYFFNGT